MSKINIETHYQITCEGKLEDFRGRIEYLTVNGMSQEEGLQRLKGYLQGFQDSHPINGVLCRKIGWHQHNVYCDDRRTAWYEHGSIELLMDVGYNEVFEEGMAYFNHQLKDYEPIFEEERYTARLTDSALEIDLVNGYCFVIPLTYDPGSLKPSFWRLRRYDKSVKAINADFIQVTTPEVDLDLTEDVASALDTLVEPYLEEAKEIFTYWIMERCIND